MQFDRIIETCLNLGLGIFAAIWLGLVVSAGAAFPVVGFAVAIPATLVIYALRAAVTGSQEERLQGRLS